LPSTSSIKRTIQRTRQREGRAPPTPTNLRDLVIPDEFTKLLSGERFLLFDSGPSDDRILIFSTQRNLQLLVRCQHWYADGTFKCAPPLFNQLYTIHGVKYHNVIPSIFALMPNRTEATYERVFTALKSLEPSLQPTTITTNYELASINALLHAFPTTSQRVVFPSKPVRLAECPSFQKSSETLQRRSRFCSQCSNAPSISFCTSGKFG
jgi:hypothetical protein